MVYELFRHGHTILFADDTILIVKDKSVREAVKKTNIDLNRISNWLNMKKLMLNKKKTQWMLFSRSESNGETTPVIKIEDDIIDRVERVKYLGILIDEKLSFKSQVMKCLQSYAS